jgi:hypothetical protein
MNDSFERPLLKALWCIALSLAIAAATADAADRPGASILASVSVVDLPQEPIYWHLDMYRTRAEADASKGPRSTVVETFAKVWLFTLAEVGWRPIGGTRVATIGPLATGPDGPYTASYMQAAISPGCQTDVHQHGGPLTSVGSEVRRSLVLVLHDAAQPWKVPTAQPWVPKGLCMKPKG